MLASSLSFLDNLRLSNGAAGLINYYRHLLRTDSESAIEIINDNKLRYATLFILRYDLAKMAATEKINPLYRRALKLTSALIRKRSAIVEKAIRSGHDDSVSALKWMVGSGYEENDVGRDYDQLMGLCCSLLTKSFKDTSVLPEIAEMIFARHRNGKQIHELVWAFFEARSLESLELIARRLASPDSRDVSLAKKLLCFVPYIKKYPEARGTSLYNSVLYWLYENKPFLHYTGESMQLCGSPMFYEVLRPAGYRQA